MRVLKPLFVTSWLIWALLPPQASAESPEAVFAKASKSVVVVGAVVKAGEFNLGSGVVVAPGQVVTNCHVVENASKIAVKNGKQTLPARLHLADGSHDLCQLTVPGLHAPPVVAVPSTRLKVGQRVYAIGSPEGLELSLSEGIISSLREMNGSRLIQTTAAISEGSSGGGLFDDRGRLIGITAFYVSEGQSLNFALPAEWVTRLSTERKALAEAQSMSQEQAWSARFNQYADRDDWRNAYVLAQQWTQVQPKNASAWLGLGLASNHLKQNEMAVTAYRRALAIDPDRADAWNNLGIAYDNLKQYDLAIAAYQKALKSAPTNAYIWNNLGAAYAHMGNRSKALEVYQVLRSLSSSVADHFYQRFISGSPGSGPTVASPAVPPTSPSAAAPVTPAPAIQ